MKCLLLILALPLNGCFFSGKLAEGTLFVQHDPNEYQKYPDPETFPKFHDTRVSP